MSYDLYFTKAIISKNQFIDYFEKQKNFIIENNQALYENSETGVYFIIDYNENRNDENNFCASLNLNYYRPLFFGDEAAIVVDKFISTFGFGILDPQNDGMGNGPFTKRGFINSWQSGNDFGYQSILASPDSNGDVYCKPNDELQKSWEWNYNIDSTYHDMDKDIFIPKIMYALIDNKLSSFIVWPDAIPTLIPEVDFIFIMRKKLAPKKWFKKIEDKFFVPIKSLDDILNIYKIKYKEFSAFELPSPNTPDDIKNYVKKLSWVENKVRLVSSDKVLSLELVNKYNKRNNIKIDT